MNATRTVLCLLFLAVIGTSGSQARAREGLHYFAVENLDTGSIDRRGITNESAISFTNLVLAPNTRYRIWVLEASTLEIGRTRLVTGRNGRRVTIPDLVLRRRSSLDRDADGLSDLAEMIVGTDSRRGDTDRDGVLDGAEVRQGTDPNDERVVRSGVIASVDLPGAVHDLDVADEFLAVAHAGGVTGLNVFAGMRPRIIASLPFPAIATRIACEGRSVVAVTDSALLVLDASAPPALRALRSLSSVDLGGRPTCVELVTGLAFVGLASGGIAVVDIESGSVVDRASTDRPLADLRASGDTLYALTTSSLVTFTLPPRRLEEIGRVTRGGPLTIPYKRLFVAANRVHAVHGRGVDRYEVSDPGAPRLLSAEQRNQFGWWDLALNGSGLGVAASGPNAAIDRTANASLYPILPDGALGDLVTSYPTRGTALAVEISNGLAFVADHTGGVSVLNFAPFDALGVPPAIALAPAFSVDGLEEGRRASLGASVADDVQVRNVEFWLDGVPASDVSFPFELQFIAPRLRDQPVVRLRARAFDTGGNATWTEELVVPLVPDATRPRLLSTSPADGERVRELEVLTATFDELLDVSTLPGGISLVEAGADRAFDTDDDVSIPFSATLRTGELTGFVRPLGAISPGRYRIRFSSAITDRAGNPLEGPVEVTVLVFGAPGPETDRDGDGLPDLLEEAIGLDSDLVDTDGNGVDDGDEDLDGDGLPNRFEVLLGLDLLVADFDPERDSDDDGIRDLVEILSGSDPFDARSFPITTTFFQLTLRQSEVQHSAASVSVINRAGQTSSVQVLTVSGTGNPTAAFQQLSLENRE